MWPPVPVLVPPTAGDGRKGSLLPGAVLGLSEGSSSGGRPDPLFGWPEVDADFWCLGLAVGAGRSLLYGVQSTMDLFRKHKKMTAN